ncbi:MAG TPA: GerAB/ArcD/ProY family transporter [Rhabdochlamydiaceae bacterium]|nr:GerAB/ArcD/ProY family transporter [Rhabdochlamydiaceae bacterium]
MASMRDHDQNFWQLTCIQSAACGVPVIFIGSQLAKQHGTGTAVLSIIVGNLILWIIALAVVSMAARERKDAVENIKHYFGKPVGYIASAVLILAFLIWYVLQLRSNVDAIGTISNDNETWNHARNWVGGTLGILTAGLAVGGIQLIKRFCYYAFPFLFLFVLYAVCTSTDEIRFEGTWNFSLPATASIVAVTLPGIVNLPTFFRHSKSRGNSILALCLITLFVSFFQISSLFLDGAHGNQLFSHFSLGFVHELKYALAVVFLVVSLISVNLVNIYFAASGLKNFIPRHWNQYRKYGYLLEGLVGLTMFHTVFKIEIFVHFLGNFIASFGIVLVVALLIRSVVKHRARRFDKLVNISCWCIGWISATLGQLLFSKDPGTAIVIGCYASILAFLVILFIEEAAWSLENLHT